MSKKKVIYIILGAVAAVLIAGAGVVAALLYNANNNHNDSSGLRQTENKKIDSLILESDNLLANGNKDGAVTRLEEARRLAEALGDKDKQWDIEVRIDYTKNTDLAPVSTPKGDYEPASPDASQQGVQTEVQTTRKE